MTPLRLTGPIFAASAACALALAAPSARAAELASVPPGQSREVMDLTYEVYLGGLHIFSMNVGMATQPGAYRVSAEGGTRGMIGWLYKWDIKLAAEGADKAGAILPKSYASQTDWQSNPKTMKLTFEGGGKYDVARNPPEEIDVADEGEPPASLPDNTVDPLSLALAATRAFAENGKCEQVLPVFDGKRRYDLKVKDLGPATIEKNRYSIYHGPAARCGFTMERISGFSKRQRAARQWDEEASEPPTIFVAPIREGLPPVPVRYEGAIALGAIMIHLTKAEVRRDLAEAPAQ